MQDRDVLLFARDHMEQGKPLDEAVLEFFQCLEKQHAAGRAIAVEQKESTVRLARQHAFYDRQDRRDPGAGGEADIDARLAGRGRDTEAAGRCHDIEFVADSEFIGGPTGERTAVDLFYGNP